MRPHLNTDRFISNPIVKLLAKGRHNIRDRDVVTILSAIAALDMKDFTLRDLDSYVPEEVKKDKKRRRSISTLLETLEEIGFLEKPSERKWRKKAPTLSEFLVLKLLELFEAENLLRMHPPEVSEEKVVKLSKKEKGI